MKKSVSRIFEILFCVTVLAVAFSGCNSKKVEKTLMLYNLSDYPISSVNLATSEGRGDSDKQIDLIRFSDEKLEPGEEGEYVVEIPEKDLSKVWYLDVNGSVGDSNTIGHEDNMGTIWEDGVEGFNILWDEEENNFYFTPVLDVID